MRVYIMLQNLKLGSFKNVCPITTKALISYSLVVFEDWIQLPIVSEIYSDFTDILLTMYGS